MARFVSRSLMEPANTQGQGRRVVEAVARRLQPGADDIVQRAQAAVVERQARIDSIEDESLKTSIGALPGLLP